MATLPPFEGSGMLPEGRYVCTLDEFEERFVLAAEWEQSTTRVPIFADFLAAKDLLLEFDPGLIERAWFGGSYTSEVMEPSDIDVTFILNHDRFIALPRAKRDRIGKLARWRGFEAHGLRVDGFYFTRERIADPWKGSWITTDATQYMGARGAWDDWWSRHRRFGAKGAEPIVDDSDPVRGYVEVIFDGAN